MSTNARRQAFEGVSASAVACRAERLRGLGARPTCPPLLAAGADYVSGAYLLSGYANDNNKSRFHIRTYITTTEQQSSCT
eukprot:6177960-Pleurochrysis_carterae.AAC.2